MITMTQLTADQDVTRIPFDDAAEKGWSGDDVALYAMSEPLGGKGGEVAAFFVGSKVNGAGPFATVLYAATESGEMLPGPDGGALAPVPFIVGDEDETIASLIAAVGFRDVTSE